LISLDRVRDRARAASIAAAHPGGKMPDGQRIVSINDAA
jgi:hypothetical protein